MSKFLRGVVAATTMAVLVACGGEERGGDAASARAAAVAGMLVVAPGAAVDGTVNDPSAGLVPNDSFATAQSLTNPVVLGGYAAAAPGQGPAGRLHAAGDPHDHYRVFLAKGDVVVMRIGSDDPAVDLDLYLADADRALVDASVDPRARIESVVAPATGEYHVIVHAAAGASAYLLAVGPADAAVAQDGWRLSDEFLPGEAIVLPAAGEKSTGAPRNQLFRFAAEKHAAAEAELFSYADSETRAKLETLHAIKRLVRDGTFEDAQPNFVYRMEATDPLFRHQWHYRNISLPAAWATADGAGTIVAVLDSGVALDHPDLRGQFVPGWDFVLRRAGGDDPGQTPRPENGSSYHGTHVAGTIAAATNNGTGVAGVAHRARIMPVRVCERSCSGYAIEQGLRFAAGLPNDSGRVPERPADVVNLSLGRVGGATSGEQRLYDQLRNLGITVVASAGNQDTTSRAYPAAYNGVIAVGATDFRNRRAPYSNHGSWIDVVAPGGDLSRDDNRDGYGDGVLSTWVDDRTGTRNYNYRFLQGTSMAAPHVAGVVALMKSVAPGLVPADVFALIRSGGLTDDIGEPGRDDTFGYGLINAEKAVAAARRTAGAPVASPPVIAVTPAALAFGLHGTRLELGVTNAGGGTLASDPPNITAPWLSAMRRDTPQGPVWTFSVSRAGLGEGSHATTVRFTSNGGAADVPVTMQVAAPAVADAGRQYVLLIDPATGTTRFQATVERHAPGILRYRFDGVAPGTYRLVAGSDADNDGRICGPAEACAEARTITVGATGLDGVDLQIGFPSPHDARSRDGHRRMR